MRHQNKVKKLQRTSAQRKSLISGLVSDLITHKQIKTTLAKAKGKWLSVSQVCEEIALEGQEELVFKVLLHVSSNPGAISRQESPDPGKTLFNHS